MWAALINLFLFFTDGFVKACLSLNDFKAPVLSNFLLNHFRALSILSPSLIGIISI